MEGNNPKATQEAHVGLMEHAIRTPGLDLRLAGYLEMNNALAFIQRRSLPLMIALSPDGYDQLLDAMMLAMATTAVGMEMDGVIVSDAQVEWAKMVLAKYDVQTTSTEARKVRADDIN